MEKDDLQTIPGVGPRIAQRLNQLGISLVSGLKGKNPEELYMQSCLAAREKEDPCLLYVYRLAVYYAESERPDPAKLKWWYWKNGR